MQNCISSVTFNARNVCAAKIERKIGHTVNRLLVLPPQFFREIIAILFIREGFMNFIMPDTHVNLLFE